MVLRWQVLVGGSLSALPEIWALAYGMGWVLCCPKSRRTLLDLPDPHYFYEILSSWPAMAWLPSAALEDTMEKTCAQAHPQPTFHPKVGWTLLSLLS